MEMIKINNGKFIFPQNSILINTIISGTNNYLGRTGIVVKAGDLTNARIVLVYLDKEKKCKK